MQNSRYGNLDTLYTAVVQHRTNKELGRGTSHFLLEPGLGISNGYLSTPLCSLKTRLNLIRYFFLKRRSHFMPDLHVGW